MIAEHPGRRGDYRIFYEMPTRWMDNDVYGHVNNVHYYSYFDTAIAHFLMREGGLDPWRSEVIGFCVESACRFRRAVRFPERITAGLRVARLGRTSARYEIGLFRDDDDETAADGYFVHVFVTRADQRPAAIPPAFREALARLATDSA